MDHSSQKDVTLLVDHLFRHEAGKMVATLTRIFGPEHLTLAEDVVQEALAKALRTWPFYGVPANPAAWIMRAARNQALDLLRREKVFRDKQGDIAQFFEVANSRPVVENAEESELGDDRLTLMFVCCHPLIPVEAQVALALKTLCGFSVLEISSAFLTSEAAIAKRLTRAKQRIGEAGIRFEVPWGEELVRRLDTVLQALYLLFNEGYKASTGERLVKEEICHEAIRLTRMLARCPVGDDPKTHALLSLMLLDAARFATRVDSEGNLLRLREQDRRRWDHGLIAMGLFHLAHSAKGDCLSRYHLEAGIAACHCSATDYASTDWTQIAALYDQLMLMDFSPVVGLNRAVAIAQLHGPEAGLEAVERLANRDALGPYYLLYAVLAEFEIQQRNYARAASHLRKAIDLTASKSERLFLEKRIQECDQEVTESH